ncbi:MAG: VTT domain-containing protein [Candidatus Levybacteria bacterium]|nr:VTT domain-containing protein [Candidatus Levybacteria bacterium]
MPDFLNIEHFVQSSGQFIAFIVLFCIIFAETGLFIGFLLPGDSLLFTTGILASQGYLNIYILVPVLFVAAIAGDSVGYAFGHRVGRRLFQRKDSFLFRKDHLLKAEAFYEKHGGKTIILARFMPVIRTFAPIVAGISKMEYRAFLTYNIVGAFIWAVGLPTLGYFLGKVIPDIDKYLLPIIGFIVLVSVAPPFIEILKTKEQRKKIIASIKSFLQRN